MLSIHLLGAPQITFDDRPLAITRRKSRAVLYYLAADAKPLTRDHLLAFFWPDHDRVAAQQVLRTTLHGLRKALGTALIVDDNSIALASDVEVDVRLFESRLTSPTSDIQLLTSTLQLYRGDFLTNFSLADTPAFDDWVTSQQEHYRRLAVRGFSALSNWHEAQNDYRAAIEAIDRALAFDRLQEDLQRTALRLHYLAGDRAAAIRRYESFRKLLDEEMGVPPMIETRNLYDAIINDKLPAVSGQSSAISSQSSVVSGQWSVASGPVLRLPFTGRDKELRALREATASHQLALIEGEPGIGKTRLAEEFMRSVNGLALVGVAHELEHGLPYQPIIEALRDLMAQPDWPALRSRLKLPDVWLAEVARLVPEITGLAKERSSSPGSATADESRIWEGLHQFLIALAREQRVVFFLDDLQWADASTLAVLGYLIRGNAPVIFLAAARPIGVRTPLASLLQALTREGCLLRLSLDRLTPDDTLALARQLSPAYAYPLADWLTRQAEGNPYILSELIRHARDTDLLQANGALNLSALSSSPIVPPSIYSLIQSRLAKLSEAARRLLDTAVAMGRVFEFKVVARAAALSDETALDALDELRAARLIEPQGSDGEHYAFDHTLTMEVAYREVGEPRHRLLHRRVADAMAAIYGRQQLDSIAGLLAWHYTESGAIDRAAPHAFRAGQLAAKIAAWHEAIDFYQQALAADHDDAHRAEILMALGNAHFRASESPQASEAFRAALNLYAADSTEADAARLALARSLIEQARFAEAIELARQVRDAGRAEHLINAELLWGTLLSIEGADLIGAAEHLHAAETLCAAQADRPDLARRAQIKFEQGSVAAQQGDLERAVALYRETRSIAAATDDVEAMPFRILADNNLAYHLNLLNDPTAIDYALNGLSLAREAGVLGLQPFLLSTLGEIMLARNDLTAAEKYFNEGLALSERLSRPERIAGLTANLGRVAQQLGEEAVAIHRLSTALAQADGLGIQHLAAQIRLWLVPLLPPKEARLRLSEARAIAESSGRKRLLEEARKLEQQLVHS